MGGVEVGGLIAPTDAWDLDHRDDRRGYLGPSHAFCNRRAGSRKANAKLVTSRRW